MISYVTRRLIIAFCVLKNMLVSLLLNDYQFISFAKNKVVIHIPENVIADSESSRQLRDAFSVSVRDRV